MPYGYCLEATTIRCYWSAWNMPFNPIALSYIIFILKYLFPSDHSSKYTGWWINIKIQLTPIGVGHSFAMSHHCPVLIKHFPEYKKMIKDIGVMFEWLLGKILTVFVKHLKVKLWMSLKYFLFSSKVHGIFKFLDEFRQFLKCHLHRQKNAKS